MSPMSPTPPVPDNHLTPEQYEKLTPLLKLASIGGPDLVKAHTPAETRITELKGRVITALREHGTITKAAAAAGITPRTVQRWQLDDPTFAAEVTKWRYIDQADELAATLYEITKLGLTDAKYANAAVKAAETLLKSLAPDEFTERIRQETTVTVNHQVQVVTSYRDKQRAALQSINRPAITIDAE